MRKTKKPKVLMVGLYDFEYYARAKIIYKGLKENKVDVKKYLKKEFLLTQR